MSFGLPRGLLCLAASAAFVLAGPAGRGGAADGLEVHELRRAGNEGKRLTVPADAGGVFTHEGRPLGLRVAGDVLALEFARSGVLIDRATGKLKQRFTAADGWPANRPAPFGKKADGPKHTMVGPGVVDLWTASKAAVVVAAANYDGRTWSALQPASFLRDLTVQADYKTKREQFGAWTPILRKLHEECGLEATGRPGEPTRRYTVKDGLASNI